MRESHGAHVKAGRGAKIGCISVQVLTAGTWDAPPALLLTVERADTVGYLINCGEGVQRFCVEHKLRLTGKLQRILMTRLTWPCCGGLPGMLLNMNDGAHSGSVRLHGPARLQHLVRSFRGFVTRHAYPREISETPDDWPDGAPVAFDESGVVATPILLDFSVDYSARPSDPSQARSSGEMQSEEPMDTSASGTAAEGVDGGDAAASEGGFEGAERSGPFDGAATADDVEPAAKRARLVSASTFRGTLNARPSSATALDGSTAEEAAAAAQAVMLDAVKDGVSIGGHGSDVDLGGASTSGGDDLFGGGCGGPGPAKSREHVPVLCWLLEMPAVPPKFNAEAAERLGIPSGRPRSLLCEGKAVTLPSGAVIQPSEVLMGGQPGELVLILDVPSAAHISLLANHPAMQAYRAGADATAPAAAGGAEATAPTDPAHASTSADASTTGGAGAGTGTSRKLDAVIHISPAEVCSSPEYIAWCAAQPAATQHLFTQFTPREQRFAFIASARMQLKLHGVHEQVFPKPLQMSLLQPSDAPSPLPSGLPPSSVAADMLCRLTFRPLAKAGIDREEEETLVRWQDHQGSWNTLAESELRWELSETPKLLSILRRLPPGLQLPPGTWQYDLRQMGLPRASKAAAPLPMTASDGAAAAAASAATSAAETARAETTETATVAETAHGDNEAQSPEPAASGSSVGQLPIMEVDDKNLAGEIDTTVGGGMAPSHGESTQDAPAQPEAPPQPPPEVEKEEAEAARAAHDAAIKVAIADAERSCLASGAHITFLGTGASFPSTYRNVSAALLQLPPPAPGHGIRRQVEFYFSDVNLPRDRFLQEVLADSVDGWVPLDVIARFPRVQALTTTSPSPSTADPTPEALATIVAALAPSKAVEVVQRLRDVQGTGGGGVEGTVRCAMAPRLGEWHVRRRPRADVGAGDEGDAEEDLEGAPAPSAAMHTGGKPMNVAGLAAASIVGAASQEAARDQKKACGIMLDAGEGCMGALYRRYGSSVDEIISGLHLVWISHMHADHHLGLINLLEARTSLLPGQPLLVVGPLSLQTWLRAASAALHAPIDFRFIHCREAPSSPAVGAALRRCGFEMLRAAPVWHCPDAWGLGLQHADGWSIVYSGDTRPCDALVNLGNSLKPGARILIHEATFDDSASMRREAEQRRHSTVMEALNVGEAMNAYRVVLTHFSQRYPRLTDVRSQRGGESRAVIAFDQMSIPFELMRDLPSLTPAYLCLFSHEARNQQGDEDDAGGKGGGGGGKGGGGRGGGGKGGGGKGGGGKGGGGKGGGGKGGGGKGSPGGGKGKGGKGGGGKGFHNGKGGGGKGGGQRDGGDGRGGGMSSFQGGPPPPPPPSLFPPPSAS